MTIDIKNYRIPIVAIKDAHKNLFDEIFCTLQGRNEIHKKFI